MSAPRFDNDASYDANGMEREPVPAWPAPAPTSGLTGPQLWDPENAPDDPWPEQTAHRRAMKANPACAECRAGKGYIVPGPGHCRAHDRHCSAAPCW